MRRAAAALAVTLLAACARVPTEPELPRSPGGAAALPSCREAWAGVPPARRGYDFATDALHTPRGNEGYQAFAERLPRRTCRKGWTVLIYMAADNEDMPPYAYWHLDDMEAAFDDPSRSAASTLDADVLVQLDVRDPPGIWRLHMFRAPAPRAADREPDVFARRTPADVRSPAVEVLEEETIPPGESLRRFLSWGVSTYPSERYLVVVWGHGLGWRPAGLPGDRWEPHSLRGGIAFDHSQRTVLDTPNLRAALAGASQAELGGRPFDVFAADACLMQSLEVATELSGVARYVVGSEQIEDYLGLPYRTFMPRLNGTGAAPDAGPGCPARDPACHAARLLPELQQEALAPGGIYANASPEAAETFVLSTLDAGALARRLHPAMQRLSAAIVAYLEEEPLRRIDLQSLLDVERGPGPGGGVPDFLGGSRDAGVFLARLRAQIDVESARTGSDTSGAERLRRAIDAAEAALDQAVVAAAFGEEYDPERWPGMAGVSVWLPHDAPELSRRADFFAPSRFYAAPAPSADGNAKAFSAWLSVLFAQPAAR